MCMHKWAAEEFGGAELGDGRLTNRLIKIASDFADKRVYVVSCGNGVCGGASRVRRCQGFGFANHQS